MKPTVYNYLSITEGLQRWTFHVQLIIIDGVSSILIDDVSSILFDEVSSYSQKAFSISVALNKTCKFHGLDLFST